MAKKTGKKKVDKVKEGLLKIKGIEESSTPGILIFNNFPICNCNTRSIAFKGWCDGNINIYHMIVENFGREVKKKDEEEYIRFIEEAVEYLNSIPEFKFEKIKEE